MTLEEAKKLIGKEAMYRNIISKLIRVAHPFGVSEGGMIIAETDNGMVINIDLLKFIT